MGKIDELIKQLCPEGVSMVSLGEICSIKTGKLNANAMVKNGPYPFFTCDEKPYTIDTYAFDGESILVSGNGSKVGHVNYCNGKFNAYQRTYVLMDFKTDVFFVLHYLKAYLREYIIRKSNKASVPYIKLPHLVNFKIPLPPLAVQKEIVEILDTFTGMIDNLQKELEKRQKQFEHYRDQMLTFKEGEVQMKPIKEIFETRNGYTPSTKNQDFWEGGYIPWFKMDDIRDNGHILKDSHLHINPIAVKGKGLFKANSIIVATSATIGEHALVKVEHLSNQRFTNLYPKKDWVNMINMKYMYYYMYFVDQWCKEHVLQGGFASVDMGGFYKLDIPIPSLDKQQEIVDKLDTFEALISNIKQEIELRQKQYEYYREKLLTFE